MLIKKELKLSSSEYYNTHLQLINPLLPVHLTPKEIEVLANFMCLTGLLSEHRFGTTANKEVKTKMNISTAGLSNYMRALKDKGFINNGIILPILFPENGSQTYQFKLVNYEI